MRIVRKELVNNWTDTIESSSINDSRMLQSFKKELRVLKLLRHTRNPRIVEILGSYVYNGVYNLLFPVADMDLEEFLGGKRASWAFKYRDEMFEELRGLTSALEEVHLYRCQEIQLELIGCHHDLKPSNILIFNGRLTLADFGLSRLIPPEQGSNSNFKDCLGDYFSPECLDNKFSRQKIGRPSDIWSLGCLVAELITFYEYGRSGILKFRSARKTEAAPRYITSWFHSGGKLKTQVNSWLSKLIVDSQDSNVKALIALTRTMLDDTPSNRPNVSVVQLQLTSITLASLTKRVTERFIAFLQHHDDYHLDIELNRFQEWCDGAGGTFPERNFDPETLAQLWSGYRQHILDISDLISDPATDRLQGKQYSAEDLEDLHFSIREHNDSLWRLLPPEMRKIMRVRWHRRRLEVTQLDEIEIIEHNADHEIASLATMKRLFLLMEQSKSVGDPSPLEIDDITLLNPCGDHSLALYTHPAPTSSLHEDSDQEHVLVEWWLIEDWDPALLDELFVRMSSIADLPNVPHRPLEFRVLSCKGFFYDPPRCRFGVVYALPQLPAPSPSPSPQLTTLRTFIDDHQSVSQGTRPPLGDRIALALALCLCVAEFHAVGWLHHDLCADNIVFAPSAPLRSPYVIGFNHSRPDEAGNCSVQRSYDPSRLVYQHPAYRAPGGSARWTRAFDYYGLGVVLLEIGMWYGVQRLENETRAEGAEGRREKLKGFAERLGAYVGEVWMEAVVFCLSLEDREDVEEEFYRRVIGPLSRCRV